MRTNLENRIRRNEKNWKTLKIRLGIAGGVLLIAPLALLATPAAAALGLALEAGTIFAVEATVYTSVAIG